VVTDTISTLIVAAHHHVNFVLLRPTAFCADTRSAAVKADRLAAVVALTLSAAVKADLRPTAVFALTLNAVVNADLRPAAFFTGTLLAAVNTDLRPAALFTGTPLAAVNADRRPIAVFAATLLAAVLAKFSSSPATPVWSLSSPSFFHEAHTTTFCTCSSARHNVAGCWRSFFVVPQALHHANTPQHIFLLLLLSL
jgi:hypothetical protein